MRLPALLAVPLLTAVALAQAPPAAVDLRARIEGFAADVALLQRRYDVPMSGELHTRLRERLQQEQAELAALPFETLPTDARIDWALLDNHVRRELQQLDEGARRAAEIRELVPFAPVITALGEARRRLEPLDAPAAATTCADLATAITKVREAAQQGKFDGLPGALPARAGSQLQALRASLRSWFDFRDGYDPQFSWWVQTPYQAADQALGDLQEALRARRRQGR